jgi:lipopolysaccharide export LptBFGC system permease protein LptF
LAARIEEERRDVERTWRDVREILAAEARRASRAAFQRRLAWAVAALVAAIVVGSSGTGDARDGAVAMVTVLLLGVVFQVLVLPFDRGRFDGDHRTRG